MWFAALLPMLVSICMLLNSYGFNVPSRGSPYRRWAIRPLRNEEESRARDEGRPPVIPFDFSDFARDDVPIPIKRPEQNSPVTSDADLPVLKLQRPEDPDNARPTGYDNDELDDPVPDAPEDIPANSVVRFLKDVYIGSPYDSRRRQQARYVVRNITGISLIIGVVFTLLWYMAPGKFISYKGSQDPATSSAVSRQFVNPEDLLRESDADIGSDFLDDRAGLADNEIRRFAIPKAGGDSPPNFHTQNI